MHIYNWNIFTGNWVFGICAYWNRKSAISCIFVYFCDCSGKRCYNIFTCNSPAIPVVISKPLGFAGYIGVSSCLNSFYSFPFQTIFSSLILTFRFLRVKLQLCYNLTLFCYNKEKQPIGIAFLRFLKPVWIGFIYMTRNAIVTEKFYDFQAFLRFE